MENIPYAMLLARIKNEISLMNIYFVCFYFLKFKKQFPSEIGDAMGIHSFLFEVGIYFELSNAEAERNI